MAEALGDKARQLRLRRFHLPETLSSYAGCISLVPKAFMNSHVSEIWWVVGGRLHTHGVGRRRRGCCAGWLLGTTGVQDSPRICRVYRVTQETCVARSGFYWSLELSKIRQSACLVTWWRCSEIPGALRDGPLKPAFLLPLRLRGVLFGMFGG